MRNTIKAFAVALGIVGAASVASADDTSAPPSEIRMPGMTDMMQQMGPTMERCDKMMAAMNDHMETAPHSSDPAEDNG